MQKNTEADRVGKGMLEMQLPSVTSPVVLEHFHGIFSG